ncbi:hypothetical protein O181_069518 [Austropuccinia psidii MF-1]|uniref:CCHC-type domain-containing protein n=1 Tax=Austropuccinia psidii MF-1 TaxID=1389203 RepID=A0A9Q3EXC6_9BASI|nr:hypothetical protein [Austropuccinia psidii MF-1]
MLRVYPKQLHPELYKIDKYDTTQQESTMSTAKPTLNPAELEPNTSDRLSRIQMTISQATALIKNEHILKLDGSNFNSWENKISIILDDFIDDPDFLHCEGPTLSSNEKICRGVLIYSLPEAIQSEVIHLRPYKAIYDHLRRLYHVITCAGQLSSLEELLHAQMQPDEAPSSYAIRLWSSASNFTQRGGNFSKDLLLGLLLQQGIQNQEMVRTVMSRLENEIANKGRNPSLATCHQILELAYQQHQRNTTPTKQDEPVIFNQASVISSPSPNKGYDTNVIDPATLRVVIQGTCHNCKKVGHFARDCWAKRIGNLLSPPMNNSSQFRAYHPIITLPRWPAARPLASTGSLQPKPVDYYQPQYPNRPTALVNVCFAELGDDEDLMNLFQAEVASEDNVGGGDNKHRGWKQFCDRNWRDGKIVLIKNVFYSPNATATLISPASILQTGGKMYTQGDNLLFCNTNNVPLLTANFNAQWRCWFFPPYLNANELRGCMTATTDKIVSLKTRVDKRHDCVLAKDRVGADIGKHLNNTMDDCADCLIAKRKRWNELLPTKRPTEPMDIVASDVMGPFDEANINSGCWALTIRDIGLTYGECHIIATKADAAAVLQGIVARWEVSLPMHHEQNGVAEQYNRSVADMGRMILRSSGLGTAFWGYAFMWAVYTNNNILNERTGRLTPAKILFNEKPQLDRM